MVNKKNLERLVREKKHRRMRNHFLEQPRDLV